MTRLRPWLDYPGPMEIRESMREGETCRETRKRIILECRLCELERRRLERVIRQREEMRMMDELNRI